MDQTVGTTYADCSSLTFVRRSGEVLYASVSKRRDHLSRTHQSTDNPRTGDSARSSLVPQYSVVWEGRRRGSSEISGMALSDELLIADSRPGVS